MDIFNWISNLILLLAIFFLFTKKGNKILNSLSVKNFFLVDTSFFISFNLLSFLRWLFLNKDFYTLAFIFGSAFGLLYTSIEFFFSVRKRVKDNCFHNDSHSVTILYAALAFLFIGLGIILIHPLDFERWKIIFRRTLYFNSGFISLSCLNYYLIFLILEKKRGPIYFKNKIFKKRRKKSD